MTDDRWRRIERIYHAALEQPASDRAAFVRREAEGDVELVGEIEALLAYDEQPAAFTQHSAMELAARALAADGKQYEPDGTSATFGAYDILRPLGAGGMGDVHLAYDSRLARNVALKVLRADLSDAGWIAAFRQEALAASALNHPNILTIYEIGCYEGTRFIAAEYVDGVTLRERLRQGPLAPLELVDIAVQVAEGLAAAHEAGVVHRDIKPENVMLRADGLVKILDFGIATRTNSDLPHAPAGLSARDGPVLGTTGYMSPEQRQGLAVDVRTDVWSLGVVIYEMALQRLPAEVAHEDAPGARHTPRPPAVDECAGLPPDLERMVRRALSRDPADRYETARELAHELRALRRKLDEGSGNGTGIRWRLGRVRAANVRTMRVAGAAVLVLIAVTAFLVAVAGRSRESPAITSIGVMPLGNAGEIRDAGYLADGIAASLRSRLSQFSSIRQAAASEAARYERLGVSPAQAGREMRTAAVLAGTLERRAETVIVRLELVRSADGAGLWKRQFVRPIDDLLTLQTEIARELVEALGHPPEPFPGGSVETRDPAAYQLYARGRYHVLRRTPEDLRKGLEYLREAVALDPGYGRAYAKLAEGHILLAMTSDVAPMDSFPLARTAAEHALTIEPGLSEARVSMGIIKFWFDWDWSGAEAEFKRAIAAKQPDPAAHTFYGHLLSNLGDHAGALQQMRRALDYEPHSALVNALFAQCLYYERRDDESLAHLRKTLDLDPALWLTYNMMGRIYGLKGMYPDALRAFDRATELGGSLVVRAAAAHTLAASGRRDEARAILDQLKARAAQTYVPPSNLALVHLGLGEHEEALDRLDEAVETRDLLLTFLAVEPRWAALAGQPRFTAVLGKVGLKQ
ncbi:MAG TPA: protein kinase [Vicinamibacterales bacterium]|nr:protein kinase [Vicinamibacterales bacterium]